MTPPPGYRPPPPGARLPPATPRRRAGPPDPGRGGLFKIAAIAALVIVALAAAGAAAVYIAGPSNLVRDQIVARVKSETGRDLEIQGAASFTVFPTLGVSMADVSLSAPPGMTAPPLLTVKKLTVSVALMPLLKREVEIKELRLDEPVLNLQRDADGRASWDFAGLAVHPPARVRLAQAGDPAVATDAPPSGLPAAPGEGAAPLDRLTLGDIRIARGTLLYVDQRSGAFENVGGIELKIAAPAFRGTASAEGSFNWRGEKLAAKAEVTSPEQLLQSAAARVLAEIEGETVNVRYDGTVRFADALDAEGNLALSSPSLHRFLAFAQKTKAADGLDRPLTLTGKLSAANNTYTLSGATGAIDRAKGSGDIAVTTGGARPIVRANLKFAELDLNAILGTEAGAAAAPQPASPGIAPVSPPVSHQASPPAPGNSKPQSIEDLLKADPAPVAGPKVRGFTRRAGWNDEPYDFTLLNLVDADARLTVGRLLYKEIKVGRSLLTVALKGSVLRTDFTEVDLYGGKGKGLLAIDASDAAHPRITANVALDGVEGRSLLRDAADIDWLTGKGRIALGVTGHGKTQRAIMNSLGGSADISFTDGAIVGVNIPGMLRNAAQGRLGGLDSAPTETTDFSKLSSSWAINNGVARNSDLQLVGPLLRVTGEGAVKLGERALDYTLKPKLVAEPKGQGGTVSLAGIEVPLRIQGPWEKPKFSPDLKSVIKDPGKAVDTIREIGKQFKGKDANEILKGLFGGKKSGPSEAAPADAP